MNIFKHADGIVNERKEEKEREYGEFEDSMRSASVIASEMTGHKLSTDDMYKIMIALKMSRLRFNSKYDTILDSIAYLGAYNNKVNPEVIQTTLIFEE